MLSRVANSAYWMARYVERAENLARFIDVTLNLMLDQPHDALPQWEPLVRATGDDKEFDERYGDRNRDNVIRFLTFDREYSNSIITVLRAARENARSIRESISSETWEQLNEFYHFVNDASEERVAQSPTEFFQQVKRFSTLIHGVTDCSMEHGQAWHFMNLGRLLERADKTSRILDVKYFTLLPQVQDVGTTIDDLQWSAVLRSVSGLETYRRHFHGITLRRIIQFLVLDRGFPRSVHFCLIHADQSLHEISGTHRDVYSNAAEQRLGRLRSELAYLDVDSIVDQGMHEFIDSFQGSLNGIGEAIFETFFASRPVD